MRLDLLSATLRARRWVGQVAVDRIIVSSSIRCDPVGGGLGPRKEIIIPFEAG